MDPRDSIWRSAHMHQAIGQGDLRAIIRLARRAADMTLADLGRAVGYTASSLSRMENGKQPLGDAGFLRRVAGVLDIAPHLLGLEPQPQQVMAGAKPALPGPGRARVTAQSLGEETEEMRRRNLLVGLAATTVTALASPPASAAVQPRRNLTGLEDLLLYRWPPAAPAGMDPTVATVTAAVESSRDEFGAARYDRLARALPARITLAHELGAAGHPERAATAVAEMYNTATRLCIKLEEDELSAVTADRALTAALNGADPLTIAESYRMVSSAWRRAGHLDRATEVLLHAAQQLSTAPVPVEAERLSVQGNLYATAAYTAAKAGDRDTALQLIAEADATAGRLGCDTTLHGAVFGPSQVLLHQISICQLLGDAGQAITHARSVNAGRLPNAERRARYWTDVARAFDQWRKPEQCYRALLAAEEAAPQEVRRPSVKALTETLLHHDRTLPGVRAFAHRVGIPR
ncbi:helix-turn-helix domain-containing protein [Streptomyces sp. NPDC048644]|uniref:helix-turn-helix domain-containing protein n=1 Tax=Streptomyces sp. NPDC048644 TaxID=3365582 RepID=UPI00371C340D